LPEIGKPKPCGDVVIGAFVTLGAIVITHRVRRICANGTA
jgi:hypothetical protein